jgi:hypothetical protein
MADMMRRPELERNWQKVALVVSFGRRYPKWGQWSAAFEPDALNAEFLIRGLLIATARCSRSRAP